jgi:lipopolysaccharide transport system ATP-binding protein
MNDSLSVSVHNVSKRYMLYEKPRDRLKHSLFRPFGRSYGHEFWALQDINFELRRGETLGVIGRNGSGKSTLLQIIAGTLTATTGEVNVNGRVAALLELGSGFNPEYTGRENIFINGAILGIPHREMEGKIEEIISFADIGEFIDQPVKSYSSGMFVRLAFSVTTGLDAKVLLIDEALAVGDIFFRQRCYQRLEDLREKGVSIILVSHAMGEVEQFCQRALLLSHGSLLLQGPSSEVVKRYYLVAQERIPAHLNPAPEPLLSHLSVIPPLLEEKDYFWPSPDAFLNISEVAQMTNGWARCTGVALCDGRGQTCASFQQGETASFFYEFAILRNIDIPAGGLEIQNERGIIVHGKSTLEYGSEVPTQISKGSRLRFRQNITLEIAPGEYTFNLGMVAMSLQDYQARERIPHVELDALLVRVCLLTSVSHFKILMRMNRKGVQLLHHGVANLPGDCQVYIMNP